MLYHRKMAKDNTQVNFRMPVELREKLGKSAFENNRSVTAEIISRLEDSFSFPPESGPITDSQAEQIAYRIVNRVMREIKEEDRESIRENLKDSES